MKIKSPIGFLALWSAFLAGGLLSIPAIATVAPPDKPVPDPFFGQRPIWFKPSYTPDPVDTHDVFGSPGVGAPGGGCLTCTSDGFLSGGLCFNVGDGVACGLTRERCVTVGQKVGVSGKTKVSCGDGIEQELGWSIEHTFTVQECESITAGTCQVCFLTVCYGTCSIRTTRCHYRGPYTEWTSYRHDVRLGGSVTWQTRCWGAPSDQPDSESEADSWACELCASTGHNCHCDDSQNPPKPPAGAAVLPGVGTPTSVHCVIEVGRSGVCRDTVSLADLSLPALSAAYAQLLSAGTEHAATGEPARYYLECSGLILASGTAEEIASLIDHAAMSLVNSPSRGDLDSDGSVTVADIVVFIETLGGAYDGTELPVVADLDADLALDATDLMILMENLGN